MCCGRVPVRLFRMLRSHGVIASLLVFRSGAMRLRRLLVVIGSACMRARSHFNSLFQRRLMAPPMERRCCRAAEIEKERRWCPLPFS